MAIPESARAVVSAVAASLGPAPPDNPDAARRVTELREEYNRRYEQEMRSSVKRPGLNMILPKEVVKGEAVPIFGHVPGVKPGAKFKDRGQLFVTGVHATLMKGIHAPSTKHPDFAKGAYSVVMSGGYVDDEDMGESFWYTGEGGIDASSKRQVRDQSMERGANAALRNNCNSRTPPSKDGPLVCKFLLQGVPGHSTVNTKVEFGSSSSIRPLPVPGPVMLSDIRRRYQGSRTLLSEDITGGREPVPIPLVNEVNDVTLPADFEYIRENVWAPGVYELFCFLYTLSPPSSPLVRGSSFPLIPPFATRTKTDTIDTNSLLNQITSSFVAPILKFMDEEMSGFTRGEVPYGAGTEGGETQTCGLAFNRRIAEKDRELGDKLPQGYEPHLEEQYNTDGCLIVTDPCGLHECGAKCKSANVIRQLQVNAAAAARAQRTTGVAAAAAPAGGNGADVAITAAAVAQAAAAAADVPVVATAGPSGRQMSGPAASGGGGGTPSRSFQAAAASADGLFARDEALPPRWQQQHGDGDGGAATSAAAAALPPPQQVAPRTGLASVTASVAGVEYAPILVLDARSMGNVGRFINHSCDGNLTIQAVFAGSHRNTFLYHVGLYACTDIPPMTELTYNYGYHSQASRAVPQYDMKCGCGAPNCVGQLM
ncbi:histone H3 methyltransferase [Volvox carteri f. nagariensis]|uniref:Histone H3 methyltransferase n=1 Tax=Volvox carteri f. nagariensis TaxID=3068 RepID=D8U227_VOLCA|nr:histone H3 methyltransferase [Volvox carteri f. nagariensis]EFJ46290.1 histone H3 methyltransferase [Volvox carteri f. nagariensis]|eukprot:XP_002952737.1 histone H3 methyltransferase [Volvox carteri f. nagariensis]